MTFLKEIAAEYELNKQKHPKLVQREYRMLMLKSFLLVVVSLIVTAWLCTKLYEHPFDGWGYILVVAVMFLLGAWLARKYLVNQKFRELDL